jgi:hypothetical protein
MRSSTLSLDYPKNRILYYEKNNYNYKNYIENNFGNNKSNFNFLKATKKTLQKEGYVFTKFVTNQLLSK